MRALQNKKAAFEKVGECLYRYSTGTYYARIKIKGKEFRRSLKTNDRALAKRHLAAFQADLARTNLSAGKITLLSLCDQYIKTVLHQAKKTIESKQLVVNRIKKDWPRGTQVQVKDVKPSDVLAFLSKQGERVGKACYNQYVSVVRDLFRLAVKDKMIVHSPADGIKQVKRDMPIRRTPSNEEFKAICEDIRNQAFNREASDSAKFVEFLGLAGLGQAEAAPLTWGDIDWARNELTTFRHKTSHGFVIPLYPQLRSFLERLKGDETPPSEEKVFRIKDAKKALAAACKRLELPHYSQRAFRRMFITRAIEKGVDVKVLAEWQGHRDGGKLILDTYSHVNRAHSNRMAQLMTEAEPENVVSFGRSKAGCRSL